MEKEKYRFEIQNLYLPQRDHSYLNLHKSMSFSSQDPQKAAAKIDLSALKSGLERQFQFSSGPAEDFSQGNRSPGVKNSN